MRPSEIKHEIVHGDFPRPIGGELWIESEVDDWVSERCTTTKEALSWLSK
jgi:predicted DNA-binding transcriptional regulator AlpA